VGTSPEGYPVKWRSHMGLKATFLAEIIASKAISAFDLHQLITHGTLGSLGKPLHLQKDVEVSTSSLKPLPHRRLHICG
jgi:hypothetical protein